MGKKKKLKTDETRFKQFRVGTSSYGLIFIRMGEKEEKE